PLYSSLSNLGVKEHVLMLNDDIYYCKAISSLSSMFSSLYISYDSCNFLSIQEDNDIHSFIVLINTTYTDINREVGETNALFSWKHDCIICIYRLFIINRPLRATRATDRGTNELFNRYT